MRKERNTWRYPVTLTVNEQKYLSSLFYHELDLFNKLNGALSMKIRQVPEGFIELSKNLRIYGECIENGYDIRSVIKDIPKNLQVVQDDLLNLSEKALIVLETTNIRTAISPRTKRNMGVQMFKFYADQAPAFLKTNSLNRLSSVFLENIDLLRKRHLQLHRKTLVIEFDEKNQKTLVKTPYSGRKFEIDGNIKKPRWDIMIIHQQPGVLVSNTTPWYVDFKKTSDDYLLKYLDNPNPNKNSSFSGVRNDYRRTKF